MPYGSENLKLRKVGENWLYFCGFDNGVLFLMNLQVAVKGTVFARMSPEQKGQLVEILQDLG